MFKGDRKYYWILAALFMLIVLFQYLQPKPLNWSKTYKSRDKIPFGCYAVYNLLSGTFAETLTVGKQTMYETEKATGGDAASLLLINDHVKMPSLDTKGLFRFLERGNKVLIAANEFSEALQDTFHLQTTYQWFMSTSHFDSLLLKPGFKLKYVSPAVKPSKKYTYSEAAVESYFSRFDTAAFKIVATDESDRPVLISRRIGKGILYLCTTPDVFTNVMLVNDPNRYYVYGMLSLIKNRNMIWDEHYKTFTIQNDSIFKFIFSNDALYAAYCLLLLSLIVFMLFSAKRKQRPIPVVVPPANSTLEFVDVITNVYYNSHNHHHIAVEKINYFYFDIRNKFRLNTNETDEAFFSALSKLSGAEVSALKELFRYCEHMKKNESLTEY
ncbi:MAG: DUF4350 domain-containing protein, partial [Bacteroidia bacterium]